MSRNRVRRQMPNSFNSGCVSHSWPAWSLVKSNRRRSTRSTRGAHGFACSGGGAGPPRLGFELAEGVAADPGLNRAFFLCKLFAGNIVMSQTCDAHGLPSPRDQRLMGDLSLGNRPLSAADPSVCGHRQAFIRATVYIPWRRLAAIDARDSDFFFFFRRVRSWSQIGLPRRVNPYQLDEHRWFALFPTWISSAG